MSKAAGNWWDGLTEKQRRFCEAYSANGGNALDAAKTAGYHHPQVEGSRTLVIARVRAALDKLRESTTKASIMTREQRQKMWTDIASDPSVDMKDRLKASELLGKAQADFINRTEISGAIQTEVIIRFND